MCVRHDLLHALHPLIPHCAPSLRQPPGGAQHPLQRRANAWGAGSAACGSTMFCVLMLPMYICTSTGMPCTKYAHMHEADVHMCSVTYVIDEVCKLQACALVTLIRGKGLAWLKAATTSAWGQGGEVISVVCLHAQTAFVHFVVVHLWNAEHCISVAALSFRSRRSSIWHAGECRFSFC